MLWEQSFLYNFIFKFFKNYHFWNLIFVFNNIRSRPRALPRFVLASQPISLTASNRWKKFRVKVYWVGSSPPTLSITTRKTGWIRSETFIRFEDQNSWQNKLKQSKIKQKKQSKTKQIKTTLKCLWWYI